MLVRPTEVRRQPAKQKGKGLGRSLGATGDIESCQSLSKPRGPRLSSNYFVFYNYHLLMASATSFLVTVEV